MLSTLPDVKALHEFRRLDQLDIGQKISDARLASSAEENYY